MKNSNFYVALVLFLLCAIGLYGILTTAPPMTDELVGPLVLPWFSLAGCVLCASLLLIRALVEKPHVPTNNHIKPILKTIAYFFCFVLYLGSMIFVGNYFLNVKQFNVSYGGGFCITSIIFISCSMYIFGLRNWYKIIASSTVVTGALVIIFGHFFNILLP